MRFGLVVRAAVVAAVMAALAVVFAQTGQAAPATGVASVQTSSGDYWDW
jgi:hypothetical protein